MLAGLYTVYRTTFRMLTWFFSFNLFLVFFIFLFFVLLQSTKLTHFAAFCARYNPCCIVFLAIQHCCDWQSV